jgi:hypothetical protein
MVRSNCDVIASFGVKQLYLPTPLHEPKVNLPLVDSVVVRPLLIMPLSELRVSNTQFVRRCPVHQPLTTLVPCSNAVSAQRLRIITLRPRSYNCFPIATYEDIAPQLASFVIKSLHMSIHFLDMDIVVVTVRHESTYESAFNTHQIHINSTQPFNAHQIHINITYDQGISRGE